MLKRNLLYSLAAVALLSLFTVSTASADMFSPGFKIRAGGFYAFIDSKISARDPLFDDSIDLDLESDLGLDDTAFSPYLEMTYRFNDRHAVLINAISLRRDSGGEIITEPFDLEFDETYTIQAGVGLKTTLDIDVYQATYMYTFYSSDKFSLAGTLGLHIADLSNEYKGQIGIRVNDQVESVETRSIGEEVTAPLPDIGLLAYYKNDSGFVFGGRVQYFQLEVGDIDGSILDLKGEVLKYLDQDQHWAIGAAYQYYGVEVDYNPSDTRLNATINYHGPSLFVQYDF